MNAKERQESQQVLRDLRVIADRLDQRFIDSKVPEVLNPLRLQYKSLADQQMILDAAKAIDIGSKNIASQFQQFMKHYENIYYIGNIETNESMFEFANLGEFVKILNNFGYKYLQYKQIFDSYGPLLAELESININLVERTKMLKLMQEFNQLQGSNSDRLFDIPMIIQEDQIMYIHELCGKQAKFTFNRVMKKHIYEEYNLKIGHYIQLYQEIVDLCQKLDINYNQPGDFMKQYEINNEKLFLQEINGYIGYEAFQSTKEVMAQFDYQIENSVKSHYQNEFLNELWKLIVDSRQIQDKFQAELELFRVNVVNGLKDYQQFGFDDREINLQFDNIKQIFVQLQNDQFFNIRPDKQYTLKQKMQYVTQILTAKLSLLHEINEFNNNKMIIQCGKAIDLDELCQHTEFDYNDDLGGQQFHFKYNNSMNLQDIAQFSQNLKTYQQTIELTQQLASQLGLSIEQLNQSPETFKRNLNIQQLKIINGFSSIAPQYNTIDDLFRDFRFLFRHITYKYISVSDESFQKLANLHVETKTKVSIIEQYLKHLQERLNEMLELYNNNSYVQKILSHFHDLVPVYDSQLLALIQDNNRFIYSQPWQFYDQCLFVDVKSILVTYDYYFNIQDHYLSGGFYFQFEPKFGLKQLADDFIFLLGDQKISEKYAEKQYRSIPKLAYNYLLRMDILVQKVLMEFGNNSLIKQLVEVLDIDSVIELKTVYEQQNVAFQRVFKFLKFSCSNSDLHAVVPPIIRPWLETQILLEHSVNLYKSIQCFLKLEDVDDPVYKSVVNHDSLKIKIATILSCCPELQDKSSETDYSNEYCDFISLRYFHLQQDLYLAGNFKGQSQAK